MIRKRFLWLTVAILIMISLSACDRADRGAINTLTDSEDSQQIENTQSEDASGTNNAFPFTLTTKDGASVTFTHVPERVIAANANTGDQLMALGLEDKIIATAYNNSQVNPKWRERYESIPIAVSYTHLGSC